eukprot:29442-Pelagococcus_subviridis.AAC.6
MRNPVKKYGVNLKTRCSARYSPIAAYPTRSASATWNRIGARISSANCRHARIFPLPRRGVDHGVVVRDLTRLRVVAAAERLGVPRAVEKVKDQEREDHARDERASSPRVQVVADVPGDEHEPRSRELVREEDKARRGLVVDVVERLGELRGDDEDDEEVLQDVETLRGRGRRACDALHDADPLRVARGRGVRVHARGRGAVGGSGSHDDDGTGRIAMYLSPVVRRGRRRRRSRAPGR